MSNLNPFSMNRAEFMDNLWKYYVPFTKLDLSSKRPMVIEGGRGTGKTMFFLCNSWKERLAQLSKTSENYLDSFIEQKEIGLYYKVDGAFTDGLQGDERTNKEWRSVFSTYLSVALCQQLFQLLEQINVAEIITDLDVENIVGRYYKTVRGEDRRDANFSEVIRDCSRLFEDIENVINTETPIVFRQSTIGSILCSLIDEVRNVSLFRDTIFKIYIDEYESLTVDQQKLINTLIKKSDKTLIYSIGMRPNGMRTRNTVAANEIIQEVHDYIHFNFDEFLYGDEYKNALKSICEKRLQLFAETSNCGPNSPSTDIEYYLGNYDAEYEVETITSNKANDRPKFFTYLRNKIIELTTDYEKQETFAQVLCDEAPPLNARLHLALLLRAKQYKPTVEELYNSYCDWKSGKRSKEKAKYDEWMKNTKGALVFLLAKDYRTKKLYFGFDTFVALSSGIVRYFLELCEQAFSFALMQGFEWCSPQYIQPNVQSKAAYYVSRYNINEIETYAPYGREIRVFVQYLGEIFRDLHRNDNLTLGEPEPNHFTTNSLGMNANEKDIIDSAVMWTVLQVLKQTKGKSTIDANVVDYHLNKIYAPYFEISYYKNRKITLEADTLKKMLSGDVKEAGQKAKDYLKDYWKNKEEVENTVDEMGLEQLSLGDFT